MWLIALGLMTNLDPRLILMWAEVMDPREARYINKYDPSDMNMMVKRLEKLKNAPSLWEHRYFLYSRSGINELIEVNRCYGAWCNNALLVYPRSRELEACKEEQEALYYVWDALLHLTGERE